MVSESQAKMKVRAHNLVLKSTKGNPITNWYALLPEQERQYIEEVLNELKSQPTAVLQIVAIELKRELVLDVSVATIARTLRELRAK